MRVEEILKDSGVLLTNGHFLLTSGRHSAEYMQCAKIQQYPWYVTELTEILVSSFAEAGITADMVVCPAVGGIIIGYELARQLKIRNAFAERENGVMTLRRSFAIPAGARVIVAEDVITTGGSVCEVIKLVKDAGAELVGVALLVDRSNGKIDFGVKTIAAYTAEITSYTPEECPICKAGEIPLVKLGSRGLAK
ncbi:MAG: orotate phosphoribosyltransferase [Defluviitaleaceae bacterium]|nr:orotate phosphoribosyltransferase [Defluviitaleaceae bacterium]